MYSARQALRAKGASGNQLPTVFKSLEEKGVFFLRGQLCLVAAGPGCGKSIFTLTLAEKAGVSALIFSADSNAFTQLSRLLCITQGWTVETANQVVRDEITTKIDAALKGCRIEFCFEASPSLDRIEMELAAFYEKHDEYPEMIVVDNITDVDLEDPSDNTSESLDGLMSYLHDMARRTDAAVFGLHHVLGEFNNSDQPVPLRGVKGQIGRVPELILTLHRPNGGDSTFDGVIQLGVSAVKNRGGIADPSGQNFATLDFEGGKMRISDPAPMAGGLNPFESAA